jgi:hypothetical protein
MGWLSDLVVRIKGDKTQLDSTLKGAEGSIQSFASKGSMLLKGLFTGAVITAIVGFGKAVIGASENLSDKFSFAVAGAKGALTEFLAKVASGDFSNLISGMSEAGKKARDLAMEIDALQDKEAYTKYKLSGMKTTSAELESVVKDKTGKFTLSQRKQAASDLKKIEEDILKMTKDLAQETFDVEAKAWENRNKMSVSAAKDLYEKVQTISKGSIEEMDAAYNEIIKKFGGQLFAKRTGSMPFVDMKEGVLGISEEYKKYFELLRTGEAEVLPKLFKTLQTFQESGTSAQERYNGVLRITNALLTEQEDTLTKIQGPATQKAPGIPQLAGLPGAADVLAGAPQVGAYIDPMTEQWVNSWKQATDEVTSMISDAFIGVFESIGSGSFEGFGDALLQNFGRFIANFGKMLVAMGTSMLLAQTLLKTPSIPTALAAIAAGGAAMAIGGLMMGMANKQGSNLGGSGGGGSSGFNQQNMKIEVVGKISGKDIIIASKRYAEDN